jgi:hypothetical protein
MTEHKKNGAYNLFLAGIVTGITICIAFTVILVGLGLPIFTAFPLAYTLALSVFGAFLFKIYRTTTKEVEVIDRPVMEQYPDKPNGQRCLILAAPSHGTLQDRANNWLSGHYGLVKSTALTATEKGVFMTILYEANGIAELSQEKESETTSELPPMNAAAPLRNFNQ